jgi:hypothetical protein
MFKIKVRYIIGLLFLFLLIENGYCQDNNWVWWGKTDYQDLYYDKTSLDYDSTNGTVTFLYKNALFTPEYSSDLHEKLSYTIYKFRISCKTKQFMFVSGMDYYTNGDKISTTPGDNYENIYSTFEPLYNIICK